MSIHTPQQQAIILKGIAQQILSMNVPTFEAVDKLTKEFNLILSNREQVLNLERDSCVLRQVMISACLQRKDLNSIHGDTVENKITTVKNYIAAFPDKTGLCLTQHIFNEIV